MSRGAILELISDTHAERLPLPMAYSDPAFNRCVIEACATPELIENFDRLTGCKVGRIANGTGLERMVDEVTGFRNDQLRQFAEFIHDSVYMRLPDEAIHALRLSSMADANQSLA